MPTIKQLVFSQFIQIPTNWCWAATSASIANVYAPGTTTPCGVASKVCNTECCPETMNPNPCDCPKPLEDAFAQTGNLAQPAQCGGSATFPAIQNEIDNHRVVAVAIQWANKSYHFITIYGYQINDDQSLQLFVGDPQTGKSDPPVPYNNVVRNYRQEGTWCCTYLTQGNGNYVPPFVAQPAELVLQNLVSSRLQTLSSTKVLFPNPEIDTTNLLIPLYLLSFSSLKKNCRIKLKPLGNRVVGTDDSGTHFIADVDGALPTHSFNAIIREQSIIEKHHRSLRQLKQKQVANGEYRIQILSQPSLNIEALWLHYSTNVVRDKFLLMRKNWNFKEGKLYSRKTFISILRKMAAQEVPVTNPVVGG